jgi:uncharacterized protein YciI
MADFVFTKIVLERVKMFIVQLKFSVNKSKASQYMADHKLWIKKGFDDEVFLLVGSIKPNLGGAIVAYNISYQALQVRIQEDPFIVHDIVDAEILEIEPSMTDERFTFLLN